MDKQIIIDWLNSRLEEYRAKALLEDNERFHFDTRAAEVANILEFIMENKNA